MRDQLHASCVDIGGAGVLITGDSGSGKSSLATQLMVLGAQLVADDQVMIDPADGKLIASCPSGIKGKLELYPFGVVPVPVVAHTSLVAWYHCRMRPFIAQRANEPVMVPLCGAFLPQWDVDATSVPLAAQIIFHIQSLKQSRVATAAD